MKEPFSAFLIPVLGLDGMVASRRRWESLRAVLAVLRLSH